MEHEIVPKRHYITENMNKSEIDCSKLLLHENYSQFKKKLVRIMFEKFKY